MKSESFDECEVSEKKFISIKNLVCNLKQPKKNELLLISIKYAAI